MSILIGQNSYMRTFFAKYSHIFILAAFLLPGLLLRIGSLSIIETTPDDILLDKDTPMLTSIDGYFYLDNAKRILNGTYSSTDKLRSYPEGVRLQEYPPLLSYLIAAFSTVFHVNYHWVATVIPTALSFLICFPIYFFGKRWGGNVCAYFAILVCMTSYAYANRTAFGMLDTDCLNITFPLCIAWCFLKFGTVENRIRYLYFASGMILAILFAWWWDQAHSVVLAFTIVPLLVSLVIFYRPPKRDWIIFSLVAITVLILLCFIVSPKSILEHVNKLKIFILYVTKSKFAASVFPNTGVSNLEQQGLSFAEIAANTFSSQLFLGLSFIGIVLLIFLIKSEVLFLLPLFVVGLLSFTSVRFLLFFIPILALGLGFILARASLLIKARYIYSASLCLIAVCLIFLSLADPPFKTTFFSPEILKGMNNISKNTPENAVIYAWWDIGHPLVFWGERATLADGMTHTGERTAYLGVPLASSDPHFAANYIQFLGNNGVSGIKRFIQATEQNPEDGFAFLKSLLTAGPDKTKSYISNSPLAKKKPPAPYPDWVNFIFPSEQKPVYLFLESRVLKPTFLHWLYWYGTWDTNALAGERTLPSISLSPMSYEKGKMHFPAFSLDDKKGILSMPKAFSANIFLDRLWALNGAQPVSLFFNNEEIQDLPIHDGYNPTKLPFSHFIMHGKYALEFLPPPFLSTLQDIKLVESVAKKLFLYNDKESLPYFHKIDARFMKYQLWKVNGDSPN